MNGSTETVVEELRELVNRPSANPPGNEKAVAEYLVERFETSPVSFEVETQQYEPDRPNVIARAGDSANGSILLTGHVDVVPADESTWTGDPFELRRDTDELVGRGTADMKGSVAAQITAAESYLIEQDSPGEVVLAYVVDEESTGHGTRELVEERIDGNDVDAAILGEPTNLELGLAHFGSVRYTVTVQGRRSHAARPQEGTNAIEGLRQVLNRVADLDEEVATADHEFLDRQSIKPTVLDGGVGGNVIPDEASVIVDWRFHPGPTSDEPFRERLREAFDDVAIDGAPADIDIELWQCTPGAEIPHEERIVGAVETAAGDRGHDIEPVGCNYGADTPHLIYTGDIPTVLFGPGTIDDAHSIDESIRVDELHTATDVYGRTLEVFLD